MMLALLTIKRLEGMDQIHRLQVIWITQGEEEARYLVEELVIQNGEEMMEELEVLEEEEQEGLNTVIAVNEMEMVVKVVLVEAEEEEQEVLTAVGLGRII